MIKVLRKKLIKVEQSASLYHVELVCDEVSELPAPTKFDGWIIDMGSIVHVINSGETYRLNSSGNWIPQKKTEFGGVIFTEADKEKLDSLTNPILLKGRVDTVDKLPGEAETGWLYFVGAENAESFAEYVFTDLGKWEFIGFNNINLSNYVKREQYESGQSAQDSKIRANEAAIVKAAEQSALNRTAIGFQRKNLLKNIAKTGVIDGITFTVNEDGSVKASGTAAKTVTLMLSGNTTLMLKNGKYIFSGCTGGSSTTYCLRFYNTNGGNAMTDIYDEEREIVFSNEGGSYNCSIVIRENSHIDTTFFPMLRYAEITDDTYESYVPDLQEQINELKAQIDEFRT